MIRTKRDALLVRRSKLKASIALRRATLANLEAELADERLTAMGVQEKEKNIANKIARGGFTAAFFLQCLAVLGVQTLHLDGQ